MCRSIRDDAVSAATRREIARDLSQLLPCYFEDFEFRIRGTSKYLTFPQRRRGCPVNSVEIPRRSIYTRARHGAPIDFGISVELSPVARRENLPSCSVSGTDECIEYSSPSPFLTFVTRDASSLSQFNLYLGRPDLAELPPPSPEDFGRR